MTELEKIAYAKGFIDRLANGINPLDGQPIPETDILNNIRLSRCLFFVSDVLRQVIEAGGTAPQRRGKRAPFCISEEQRAAFPFTNLPIPMSEITKKLNSLIDEEQMRKISHKKITDWLVSIGALETRDGPDGKPRKFPTEDGRQLGITEETRSGIYGEYRVILYSRDAQAFILDNIDAIIAAQEK